MAARPATTTHTQEPVQTLPSPPIDRLDSAQAFRPRIDVNVVTSHLVGTASQCQSSSSMTRGINRDGSECYRVKVHRSHQDPAIRFW